ncbi:amidohydrolase [Lawsonibacter sp. LCP25S3_F5]
MNKQLVSAIEKHWQQAVELSDDLYAHPELPDQEFRSSQKVVDMLKAAGYEVEYPYMGYPTAFRGVLKNGEGPSAAILVEYDALPGLGHACGHNAHCAMAVLAALALAEAKDQFQGTVYVFGTPAEEEAGAKIGMAANGAFDGMSLATMIHSWSGPASISDMDVLSLRCYLVEFKGVSAHAVAGPWKGHSALAAARGFLSLIDARRESFTSDVHVNGIITDGGLCPAILPDRAELRIEFRTDSLSKLEWMDDIVKKCAHGAASAMDCTVNFTKAFDDFADMVRVPVLEDAVEDLLHEMGRASEPVRIPNGSSDVGNVSYHCPAIQPLLTIGETFYALHTPEFREETIKEPAHQAIADGAKLLGSLVLRALTDEEFRDAAQKSYLAQKEKKLNP